MLENIYFTKIYVPIDKKRHMKTLGVALTPGAEQKQNKGRQMFRV